MKISEKSVHPTFIPPQINNDSEVTSKLLTIIGRFFDEVNSVVAKDNSKLFEESTACGPVEKDYESLEELIDLLSFQILLNKDSKYKSKYGPSYNTFLYDVYHCLLEKGKITEALKFTREHRSDFEFTQALNVLDLLFSNLVEKPHNFIHLNCFSEVNSFVQDLFCVLINKMDFNKLNDGLVFELFEKVVGDCFKFFIKNDLGFLEVVLDKFIYLTSFINKNHSDFQLKSIQSSANKELVSAWIAGLRAALDEEKNATDPLFSLLLKTLKGTSQVDLWLQVLLTDPLVIPDSQKQALALTFLEYASNLTFSQLLEFLHQMLPNLLNRSKDLICLNFSIDKIVGLLITKLDSKKLRNKDVFEQFEEIVQNCFQLCAENDLTSFEVVLRKFNDFKDTNFALKSVQSLANKGLISAWIASLRAPAGKEKNDKDLLFCLLLQFLKRTSQVNLWLQVVKADPHVVPDSQKQALIETFLEYGSNLKFNQIVELLNQMLPNLLDKPNDLILLDKSNNLIRLKLVVDKIACLLLSKIDGENLRNKNAIEQFEKVVQIYFKLYSENDEKNFEKFEEAVRICFQICAEKNLPLFTVLENQLRDLASLINKSTSDFTPQSIQSLADKGLVSAWSAGLRAPSKRGENDRDPLFSLILKSLRTNSRMGLWLQVIQVDPNIIPNSQKQALILTFLESRKYSKDPRVRAVGKAFFMWIPQVPDLMQKCVVKANAQLVTIALDQFDEEDNLFWMCLNNFVEKVLRFKDLKEDVRKEWKFLRVFCQRKWVVCFQEKFEKAPPLESAMYYCKNAHFVSDNFFKKSEALYQAAVAAELWLDTKEMEKSSRKAILEIITSISHDPEMLWCFIKHLLNSVFRVKFPVQFLTNIEKYVNFCEPFFTKVDFNNLIGLDYSVKKTELINKALINKIRNSKEEIESRENLHEKIESSEPPMQSIHRMMHEQTVRNKFFANEMLKKTKTIDIDVEILEDDFNAFNEFWQCSMILYKQEMELIKEEGRQEKHPLIQKEHRFMHNVFSRSVSQLLHYGLEYLKRSPKFHNPVTGWMLAFETILFSLRRNQPTKQDFFIQWEAFFCGCRSFSMLILAVLKSLKPAYQNITNKDAKQIEDQAKKTDDIMGDFLKYFNRLIAFLSELDIPERLDLESIKKIFLEIAESFPGPYKNQVEFYYFGIVFEKKIRGEVNSQQILNWIQEIRKQKEFQEHAKQWYPLIKRELTEIYQNNPEGLKESLMVLGPEP